MPKIFLGNTSIIDSHAPESVGVNPETGGGLKAFRDRLPAGATAELIDNAVKGETQRGPAKLVRVERGDLGQQVHEVSIPEVGYLPRALAPGFGHEWRPFRLSEQLELVKSSWPYHSADLPEWVESDDKTLEAVLAAEFSIGDHVCTIGRPDGWEPTPLETSDPEAAQPPAVTPHRSLGELKAADELTWADMKRRLDESGEPQALMVNVGRDAAFRLLYDTSRTSLAGPFNYMALTANATAVAATDSSLTAEITTAGGGLIRAQAAYAHTTNAATGTLTKTFTANGTDSLPVTVAKIGLFDAASAGNMGHATLLNATATLNISGDNVTVTETITITPT
jgi:hypothetical protein